MIERDEVVYHWEGPPQIDVHRAQVSLPSGMRYTAHWMITAGGTPGVVVVALRGTEILLVRSTRPAADAQLWELPRGFGEISGDGTDPQRAAEADGARELAEETGYTATEAHDIGGYVVDSSVLPTRVRVVWCEVAVGDVPALTDGETDAQRWVDLGDVEGLIADGTIADAHSLAALTVSAARRRARVA